MRGWISAVMFFVAMTVGAFSQENYGQWAHYKNIAVDTRAAGANVAAAVTNFPVLVRLTSAEADVFAQAKNGGADIRFANAAGGHRPYQIERWDSAGQSAIIWVLADTVKGNDSAATLRLYWGKSSAVDSSNGGAVFSLANGFAGVWHFNEPSGSTALDATGNAHAATPSPTPPTDTLGIGLAKQFSGAGATRGSYFKIDTGSSGPTSLNVSSDTGAYTISAWVNPTSCNFATNRYTIISKYSTQASGPRQFSLQGSDVGNGTTPGRWRLSNDPTSLPGAGGGGSNTGNEFYADAPCKPGQWQLVTGTYYSSTMPVRSSTTDAAKVLAYSDTSVAGTGIVGSQNSSGTTFSPIYLARTADSVRYFNGAMDEVIISKVQRSANWVRLSYFTQRPGATVVAVGASQSNGPSNLSYLADPANYVTTIPITPNTATVTGLVDSFTVSPALPAGLALDKNTGTISGTPTMATATANYVVTATNAVGSTTDTISITVNASLPAAPTIAYAPASVTYNVGTPIATITPTLGGGAADSIIVSPALPAGLALNKTSGVVSGTPTAVTASADYVFTAMNLGGNAKDTITISVLPAAPTNLVYPVQVATFVVGEPAPTNTPTVSGAVDSFTVAPALPAGLSFNKTNGAISGTPTAAAAATNYVVSAVNAGGSAKDTLSIGVDAAEVFSTWSRHRTVYLNTAASGANVAGTVTNFPVLVRLGSTDSVFAQSVGRGADLRFTKLGDAVRLKHQIESWDSTGKAASVWVLVDSVKGATYSEAHAIRMHWGKSGAASLSNGAVVFDTAKGFQAVWHFGEGNSDTAFDATHNKFKGAPQRTVNTIEFPKDTTGTVGRARYFGAGGGTVNSSGSYFSVPNSATGPLNFPENGTYTVSTWANVDLVGTSRTLFSKSDKAYSLELRNTGADWEFAEFSAGSGWNVVNQAGAVAQTWVHLVGVRTGPTSLLYVDGVLIDAEVRLDGSTAARRVVDFEIGRSPDGGTSNAARYYWRGMLDEIRIASVARSADWAKLEFENQKSAQTLVTLVPPSVGIGAASAHLQTPVSLTVKPLLGGVLFRLPGATNGTAHLNLTDMRGRTVWRASFAPGSESLQWNGIDQTGQASPVGIYFAHVKWTDGVGSGSNSRVFNARVPFTR